MRDFACPNCGQRLAFENSLCLGSNNPIGFDLVLREFAILRSDGVTTAAPARRMCANLNVAGCNWLVPADVRGLLCRSCSLTRTRPADGDPALPTYAEAEAAKRRLVVELIELGLPINDRVADPDRGLCFDLLSSEHEPVITGHDDGVITLDLAESDDVHPSSSESPWMSPTARCWATSATKSATSTTCSWPRPGRRGRSSNPCSATPTWTTSKPW